MASTIEGKFHVRADQHAVWVYLNDPDLLRRCIAGCQTFERTSATSFVATGRVKIGPLGLSVTAIVELEDVDAPHGCTIVASGGGRLAGSAKGKARVRLVAVPDGTMVTYAVDVELAGRLAQFGGRLIDGVAASLAHRFFTAFAAEIGSAGVDAAE